VWVAAVAALALVAATASGAQRGATAKAPPVKGMSSAAWRALVAKAKQEGSVTIYTIQAPTNLSALASRFKELYGITVNVNRKADNDLLTQINAEEGTHNLTADVWVATTKRYVLGAIKNGWIVDARGPNFFNKRYERSKLLIGKAWICGSAVLGIAWNTQGYPQGVNDMPDFLNPAFKDKLGIPDPRISPSNVDWYNWVESTYGATFLTKLAAQNPKVYGSSLTEAQAVASGEIIGATQAAGTALDLKASGAPIEYKLPNGGKAWNAAYIGMILKNSPHPNAAQLLANYLVSTEGESIVDKGFGSTYPNVPGTFYAPPRVARANDLAPDKVQAFIDRWSKLFLH
jgi:iron(III) transport system substrate-binding protein